MSDRYLDSLLPDFGDYNTDSLLDQYRKRPSQPDGGDVPANSAETIAQRSRQIVMAALGETLGQHKPEDEPVLQPEPTDTPEPAPTPEPENVPAAAPTSRVIQAAPIKPRTRATVSPDGIITLKLDIPGQTEDDEQEPEEPAQTPAPPAQEDQSKTPTRVKVRPAPPENTEVKDKDEDEAKDDAKDKDESESRPKRPRRFLAARDAANADKPNVAERFLLPAIRLAATAIAKRQMQKAEAANWPDPVEIRETEELSPKKAAKFYYQQLRPLRFRWRVCLFMCIVLAWISLGLPMAGNLGRSVQVQAGVSLLLLLTVMMASLDILVTGIRQLFELHPGGEALAAMAALLSAVDGVMVMQGYGTYLPFCAVGAFSLTSAVLGAKLDCTARARSLRTAALSKAPAAITAEETNRGNLYLIRSLRPVEGIVRRSEEPNFCQTAYAAAAPAFLIVSVVLAAVASMGGHGSYFLHTLSALLSVSASFTAFLSFPLPYALTARKLQSSGAAVVGWAGCADIGKTKRVVITDNDIFPPGTMKLTGINILEGAFVDKVVSYTSSLLTASGSGVTAAFAELIARRGYSLVQTEEFKCHEGGGLSALIGGERVLVGSAGFMNLMGIRLPQNMSAKNSVCTAISGELVAVFTLEYVPVKSVQEALATLLQGRTQPVFAIRDFNITPLMIRQLFRMPTDNFNFPTFRDRYRIAATAQGRAPVSAVIARTGMGPLVDAAESGRKLYTTCRIGAVISLVSTVVGLLIMFLLCRAGSYDTATAGNVLSYMLVWTLPVALLAFGQIR